MSLATRPPPQHTGAPPSGSRTMTITGTPAPERSDADAGASDDAGAAAGPSALPAQQAHVAGVLRLRGAPVRRERVTWDEGVVDNEGCGRKSSKICCIYHKPRAFDESSSEDESSSSSSESDSDSEPDTSRAQPARRQNRHHHHHHHHHDGPCEHGDEVQELGRPSSPNAYERGPRGKGKGRA